eukprot:NODE_3852_length_907_cov_20.230769_g3546_i0.p1 GENE.NODE_3852_length_907_cov_20.230769_g3546_i0~~NODE_3852_length_907_cov_20.230769_g3546_i0.p1  ORF type:complete len:191 (+),score=28.34 NODE_3852_length_907_cov_20.230769_g3546_i0:121-693(+)
MGCCNSNDKVDLDDHLDDQWITTTDSFPTVSKSQPALSTGISMVQDKLPLESNPEPNSEPEPEPEPEPSFVPDPVPEAVPDPEPTKEPIRMEGYLTKLGNKGLMKVKQKRWCCLMDSTLKYYESESSPSPSGVLDVSVALLEWQAADLTFQLHGQLNAEKAKKGTYEFRAGSAAEFDAWLAALQRATSSI